MREGRRKKTRKGQRSKKDTKNTRQGGYKNREKMIGKTKEGREERKEK